MLTRKAFIYNNMMAAGTLFAGKSLLTELIADEKGYQLTVLHTNDVHSRLEPFPMDGSRMQGLGGVATRAQVIQQIRNHNEQVLLLDAGDIFQGTPFFNLYYGEPEIKAMAAMNYDACTMGNHDFDGGIENFAKQMQHANFPCIVSNYDFNGTPMESKAIPYKIIKKGPLKIGIYGLGIKLKGLVPETSIASICSVTRMDPSSAPIPEPMRPAQIKAVIMGPISLIMETLTMAGIQETAPNCCKVGLDCRVNTNPIMNPVTPTSNRERLPIL